MAPPRHFFATFVLAGLLAALLFPVGDTFTTGNRNETDDGMILLTSEEPDTNKSSSGVNETEVESKSPETTSAPEGRAGGIDAIVQATDPAAEDPCPNYSPAPNSDYSYLFHSNGQWIFSDCPAGSQFYMDTCCCCDKLIEPTRWTGPPRYIQTACRDFHANMYEARGYRQLMGDRWIERECPVGHAFDRTACRCTVVNSGGGISTPVPLGPTDRCDNNRANPQNAQRYQEFQNGVWRERVCPSNLGFDPITCTCSFQIPGIPLFNNATVGSCTDYQVVPQDIRRYRHLENGVWVDRTCPISLGFDSKTCTCSVPIPRQAITPTPSGTPCPDYQVVPQDVQRYFHMENGQWVSRTCRQGFGFDVNSCSCTIPIPSPTPQGPVIIPGPCPDYEVIPEDIQRYLYRQNSVWVVRTCPDGFGFDSSTCSCRIPLPPTTPCVIENTCDNYRVFPQDVHRYSYLENGVWSIKTCPRGLGFDISTCACTIVVPTMPTPITPPEHCPNYQVIAQDIQSYLYNENGRWTTRTCPQGFGYDSSTCSCSLPLPTVEGRTEKCQNYQVVPQDVQRYLYRQNRAWVTMTCPRGYGFDSHSTCSCSIPIPIPPTTSTPPPEPCSNYQVIPQDISSYLSYENGRWTTRTCPSGFGFDSSSCSCTIRLPPPKIDPCADYEIFPQDITRYMHFENGRWNQRVCPNGLGFDTATCTCTIRLRVVTVAPPIPVPCPDYQVIPDDIQRYMHRENGVWTMKVCPTGYGYDSSRCSCTIRLPPTTMTPLDPCAEYQVFTQDFTRYMHFENGQWNIRVCPFGFGFDSTTCSCIIPVPTIIVTPAPQDPCQDYQVFDQDINRYLHNENGVWNVRTCPTGLGFDSSTCNCRIPLPTPTVTYDPCANYQIFAQDVSRYMRYENGQWNIRQCPQGYGFDSFTCTCSIQLRTIVPDPCENYQSVPQDIHLYRQLENGIWNMKTCPARLGFDTSTCRCTVPIPVLTPTTPTVDPCDNYLVYPQDIRRYMHYENGQWNTRTCPTGLGFDSSTCTCTFRVPPRPNIITVRDPCEGFRAYPQDLQRYQHLENGAWSVISCPQGIGFDSVNCTCSIRIPNLPVTASPKSDPCDLFRTYPQDVRYYLHLESNQWIQRACPQGLGYDPAMCQCNFVVPLPPTTTPIPTPAPCKNIEPHPQDVRSYLLYENNVWTVKACSSGYGFNNRTCRCDIYLGMPPTDPVATRDPCFGYAPYPQDVRQYLRYEGNTWVSQQCPEEYGFQERTCGCTVYVGPRPPTVTSAPDPCFGYESYSQDERRYLLFENSVWSVKDCTAEYAYDPSTCRCTRYVGPPLPDSTVAPDPCYGYAPYPQDVRRYLYFENNAWAIRDCRANYGFDTRTCRCDVYKGPIPPDHTEPCANYQFYPGDARRYLHYENNAWAVKTCAEPYGFNNDNCTCTQIVVTPTPTPADPCEGYVAYSPDPRRYLHFENNAWALKTCRYLYGYNTITCDCTTYIGSTPPATVSIPDPCAGYAPYPQDQRRYLQYNNNVWAVKECTYQYGFDPSTCRCDIFIGPTTPIVITTPDPCEGYVTYNPDERSYLRLRNSVWALVTCPEPYGFNPVTCDCSRQIPPVPTSTPRPDPCADYEPYSPDQRRYLHYENNAWAIRECPENYAFGSRTCRCDIYVGAIPTPDPCDRYEVYSPDPRSYLYFENNVWTLKTCSEPYGFNSLACDCSRYIGPLPKTTVPPPDVCAGYAPYAGDSRQYLRYENNAWAVKECPYQYGFDTRTCRCDSYLGPTTQPPVDQCEGNVAYSPDPRSYLHFENNVWALKTCPNLYGFNTIDCDCSFYLGPTTPSPTTQPDQCVEYQPYSGDTRHYLQYENNAWAVKECPYLYGFDSRTCGCDIYLGPTVPGTTPRPTDPCEGYMAYSSDLRSYLRLENNVWGLRSCPDLWAYNASACDCSRYVGPTVPGPTTPAAVLPCADFAPYARDARRYLQFENNAWAVKECPDQYGYDSSTCRCDIYIGTTVPPPRDPCEGYAPYPSDPRNYLQFENSVWALKTCPEPYGFTARTCDCTTYIPPTPPTYTTPGPCFGYGAYPLDVRRYLHYENNAWAVKECQYQYGYDPSTCRCTTFLGPTTPSPVTAGPCSGYEPYSQDNIHYLHFENNAWVVKNCQAGFEYDSRTCRCDIPVETPTPTTYDQCYGFRPYTPDNTRYQHYEMNAWVIRECPYGYGYNSSTCRCDIIRITTPTTPRDPCFGYQSYSQDITRYLHLENNDWVIRQCPDEYEYDPRTCRCSIYRGETTTPGPSFTTNPCDISRAYAANSQQYYRLEDRVWNLRSCPQGLRFNPTECSCSSRSTSDSCAGYQSYPQDPTRYLHRENNIWVVKQCPYNLGYDPLTCSCSIVIRQGTTPRPSFTPNACAQYRPYPGDRQRYYVLQNGNWVERQCPSGFAFNSSSCICDSYIGGPPSSVPNPELCDNCVMRSGVGYARYPGHCNLYIQCLFAGSSLGAIVVRNCPANMVWNQDTLNCDYETNVNCPPDVICPNARAVEGDWTRYERLVGNNWISENCPQSNVFDIVNCRCERGTAPGGCKPTLDLQFNQDGIEIIDSSNNRFWVQNDNVTVSNGRAYFNGQARLTVPALSNMELGDTLFINVRFQQQSVANFMQTIAANGDCDVRPSASICSGNNRVDFYAVTNGQRAPAQVSVPSYSQPRAMQQVNYALDNGNLQGTVEGRSQTQLVKGPLERRQRGLVIGGGGECENFQGYIDELQLYQCNPNP